MTAEDVRLPNDHALRRSLAEEPHARPATPVVAPSAVSCIALVDTSPDAVLEHIGALARLFAVDPPSDGADYALVEIPGGRMTFERHGEFTSLVFVKFLPGATLESIDRFPTALDVVPSAWLAGLPGSVIAASDIALLRSERGLSERDLSPATRWFVARTLAASRVLDDAAWVFADFKLKPNGCTRVLVIDTGLGEAQTARLAQRMIEVELYRMMGLLAFPMARALVADLNRVEQQLAEATDAMARLEHTTMREEAEITEQRTLLRDLTRIAAVVERSLATTAFRFSAAQAYFPIVRARVSELREKRVKDLRTLQGFLGRRLTPAADTVKAVAERQEAISNRIERATALLRTRVDMVREEQNQDLLAAMNRRSELQLKLQQSVESLSVAAITYYVIALMSYAVTPLKPHPQGTSLFEWGLAAGIPFVAYGVWSVLKRSHPSKAKPDVRS